MEYLSRLMKSMVENREFSFHPKCHKSRTTHLMFADDLMLFCNGKISSVRAMTNTLNLFLQSSGMEINKQKSHLISCGLVDSEKEYIERLIGCHHGSLPIKYLGIPLNSRSLRASECSELVQRMVSRINKWSNRFLSRAGRTVLVRSVIQAISFYWARIFVIPVKVIKAINSICANFIWKGSGDARGGHRVGWDSVCAPKEEGGLGIKNLKVMNDAQLMNQLWEVGDGKNQWHIWLDKYWTKGVNWWQASTEDKGSWVLKKLNRSKVQSNLCVLGGDTSLQWIGKGVGFSVKDIYDSIQVQHRVVPWCLLVWDTRNDPKEAFHAWVCFRGKLLTKDKMSSMGMNTNGVCELCRGEEESIEHLFFRCVVSDNLLRRVASFFQCRGIPNSIMALAEWFSFKNKKDIRTSILAMIITSTMYELWRSRNNKIFRNEEFREEVSYKRIKWKIMLKLGSINSSRFSCRDKRWLLSLNMVV